MNPWDKLSQIFDPHQQDQSDLNAIDNVLIAWPSLLSGIRAFQKNPKGLCALDFGCGAGGLTSELSRIGYHAIGYDPSGGMITIAEKNFGHECNFYQTDPLTDIKGNLFNLIVSSMVFHFIEDIYTTLNKLNCRLVPGGLLAFAVFNPDYMCVNHGEGKVFSGFHEEKSQTYSLTNLDSDKIPVFIRSEFEYDTLLEKLHCKKIFSEKPHFPDHFLQQYPPNENTDHPEYLVLVYQKKFGEKSRC